MIDFEKLATLSDAHARLSDSYRKAVEGMGQAHADLGRFEAEHWQGDEVEEAPLSVRDTARKATLHRTIERLTTEARDLAARLRGSRILQDRLEQYANLIA